MRDLSNCTGYADLHVWQAKRHLKDAAHSRPFILPDEEYCKVSFDTLEAMHRQQPSLDAGKKLEARPTP